MNPPDHVDENNPLVYTWDPNSNSGKPLFALSEKHVDFDLNYIDITCFEQHAPEYLAINPEGTVPTLIHRGQTFTQSTPMCEYIDSAFDGPSLVPENAKQRYRMRWWCRQTDINAEALSVIGWHLSLGPMVRGKPPEELERLIARIPTKERRISWQTALKDSFTDEQLENARARVGAWVMVMDRQLASTPYLVGDSFTLADVIAFANFYGLTVTVPEHANEQNTPHFLAWLRRIYGRPETMRTFGYARSLGRRAFTIAEELRQQP